MADNDLIPTDGICADLNLPLRKLHGAATALNAVADSDSMIEEEDLWFIADGIHAVIEEMQVHIKDIDWTHERILKQHTG